MSKRRKKEKTTTMFRTALLFHRLCYATMKFYFAKRRRLFSRLQFHILPVTSIYAISCLNLASSAQSNVRMCQCGPQHVLRCGKRTALLGGW